MKRTPVDGALALFTSVRAGEGAVAVLMAANAFLILAAYYLLKTVREALILTRGGAEAKAYSAAAQALLLLILVPAYGRLTSRVGRSTAVTSVGCFFIGNLAVFAALGTAGIRIAVPFFIWVGIFNVTLIAQFWSYASDAWTEEQGKRLLPVAGIGSSLGALAGARLAGPLFGMLGPYPILVLAGALLTITLALTVAIERRLARGSFIQASISRQALAPAGAFRLIFENRYLGLIAAFVLLLNVVNTPGEFLLSRLVVDEANRVAGASDELRRQFIGEFYSGFFAWVNLFGLIIQFFVVSRVFRYAGVRAALFVVPCIALGGYALLAMAPTLAVIRWAKIAENSTDYSLQNSARHALFLRTSREARYKAKAAIDSFFWRAGDVLQAGVVFAGTRAGLDTDAYARLNLALVVVWIAVVALLYREYGRKGRRGRMCTSATAGRPLAAGAVP